MEGIAPGAEPFSGEGGLDEGFDIASSFEAGFGGEDVVCDGV